MTEKLTEDIIAAAKAKHNDVVRRWCDATIKLTKLQAQF